MEPSLDPYYVGFGLREINLYPYLTWIFYGVLFACAPWWWRTERRLTTLFLMTLILETAFVIDVGFFIRPSYIFGILFALRIAARGVQFRWYYGFLLMLFALAGIVGIFMNLDLVGAAMSGESRATFLRPIIQLGQFIAMVCIMAATYTVLRDRGVFAHTMRVLHWLSVVIACAAMYEIAAIYLNLPYVNLNNMLPKYWYPGFGLEYAGKDLSIFRARATFIEPIELNNFQFLGITCSLIFRTLTGLPWRRYIPLLIIQLIVLVGTFSRSTFFVLLAIVPLFTFFYPLPARSVFGFMLWNVLRVSMVTAVLSIIVFTFTVQPEQIRQAHPVVRLFYTRIILHQTTTDTLTVLGRGEARGEVMRVVDNDRSLAFGVGIGNEANFWGGIGGTASLYNQMIIYAGIFGLSFLLLFVGSLLWELFRNRWRYRAGYAYQYIEWIFFCGFLSMLVHRLAFSGLLTDTYLWVAFAIAMFIGAARQYADFQPHPVA